MNIAVIVSGGAVETLQTGPLLQSLRRSASEEPQHLLLVCPPAAAEHARGMTMLSEVLPLAAMAHGHTPAAALRAVLALRRRRLDMALVCSERLADHAIAYFAGIARRVGSTGGLGSAFLTHSIEAAAEENRAVRWLRLAAAVGAAGGPPAPFFNPGEDALAAAEQRLLTAGFNDGRPILMLAPGPGVVEVSDGLSRSALVWEPERYAHLANQMHTRHGALIVLIGTGDDRPVVERILVDLDAPWLDVSGELDVRGAAAMISRGDLLVSGDSPLLHLAASVGTPAVGVFGPTDGRRRGPFGPAHRVVQGVDRHAPEEALQRVRVDDVLAGIESSL